MVCFCVTVGTPRPPIPWTLTLDLNLDLNFYVLSKKNFLGEAGKHKGAAAERSLFRLLQTAANVRLSFPIDATVRDEVVLLQ